METYDRVTAYQAVMKRIRETVKLPSTPRAAPQTWLAEQLGVARQLVYHWQDKGFPDIHAERIAKLLDMDPQEVCPQIPVYLPAPVHHAVVELSTPEKPFSVTLVRLLKLGLSREKPKSRAFREPPPHQESPKLARQPEIPMKAVRGFVPISAEELRNQREEAIKAGADLSVKGRSR